MENITNIKNIQKEENLQENNDENSNMNKEEEKNNIENNPKINNQKPNQTKFNLDNKYDSVLLEELNNSKNRNWRIDIINSGKEEDVENNIFDKKTNFIVDNNEINNKKENENEEINKKDRFKDFDEILLLEDNKDKKKFINYF